MLDQQATPFRVQNSPQLGDSLFAFSEAPTALSPIEIRMIRLELRLAALEARMPRARLHRLALWIRRYARQTKEWSVVHARAYWRYWQALSPRFPWQ